MTSPMLSPRPNKSNPQPNLQSFPFSIALEQILLGARVARAAWTEYAPVYLKNGLLKIERGGVEFDLILSEADLRAVDWLVL